MAPEASAAAADPATPRTPVLNMLELVKIYLRLKESLVVNSVHSAFQYPKHTTSVVEDLSRTDALAEVSLAVMYIFPCSDAFC
jgi:E3 ubiquitin-protein ligase UBR1